MSLSSRIFKLESQYGTGDQPRWITIAHSPDFAESWIERSDDGFDFQVKTPHRDADPLECLTDAMRMLIRPGDLVVVYEVMINGRDGHLQGHLPPWERRPYRLSSDERSYELMDEAGFWRKYEFS